MGIALSHVPPHPPPHRSKHRLKSSARGHHDSGDRRPRNSASSSSSLDPSELLELLAQIERMLVNTDPGTLQLLLGKLSQTYEMLAPYLDTPFPRHPSPEPERDREAGRYRGTAGLKSRGAGAGGAGAGGGDGRRGWEGLPTRDSERRDTYAYNNGDHPAQGMGSGAYDELSRNRQPAGVTPGYAANLGRRKTVPLQVPTSGSSGSSREGVYRSPRGGRDGMGLGRRAGGGGNIGYAGYGSPREGGRGDIRGRARGQGSGRAWAGSEVL
ncbi:MAG: hypothetical protein M1827_002676 [Pycnora praestabilis]|nr:MAG: hypothetical protein M1827_002676 [Pycnora praestabilis]